MIIELCLTQPTNFTGKLLQDRKILLLFVIYTKNERKIKTVAADNKEYIWYKVVKAHETDNGMHWSDVTKQKSIFGRNINN